MLTDYEKYIAIRAIHAAGLSTYKIRLIFNIGHYEVKRILTQEFKAK